MSSCRGRGHASFFSAFSAGVSLCGSVNSDRFIFGDEKRDHDLETGFDRGFFPD
jgi:hypothetical protein